MKYAHVAVHVTLFLCVLLLIPHDSLAAATYGASRLSDESLLQDTLQNKTSNIASTTATTSPAFVADIFATSTVGDIVATSTEDIVSAVASTTGDSMASTTVPVVSTTTTDDIHDSTLQGEIGTKTTATSTPKKVSTPTQPPTSSKQADVTSERIQTSAVRQNVSPVSTSTIILRSFDARFATGTTLLASDVRTHADLKAFAVEILKDKTVTMVTITGDEISVTYSDSAKLFGFIPVSLKHTVDVMLTDAGTDVMVDTPWWRVFANGGKNEQQLRSAITRNTKDSSQEDELQKKARILDGIRTFLSAKK